MNQTNDRHVVNDKQNQYPDQRCHQTGANRDTIIHILISPKILYPAQHFPHRSASNPSILESTQFPRPNKQTHKKKMERQHNTETPRNNWLNSLIRMKRGPNPGARESPRGGGRGEEQKKWPETKSHLCGGGGRPIGGLGLGFSE